MRALITGATGFAGFHLVQHLLARGDSVLACSQHGRWPSPHQAEQCQRVKVLAADLSEEKTVRPGSPFQDSVALFNPDCVFHLAALSLPVRCGVDRPSAESLAVNVAGTRHVVELAATLPRPPRVVFTSTSHVYRPPDDPTKPVDEETPPQPRSAYGQSKLLAEQDARQAAERLGIELIIVRTFQHTGPYQRPPLMLPEWIEQFLDPAGGPVVVRNKETWIDLSDVRDMVRAYRLLALHGRPGELYNAGSGVAVRTGEVFEILHRLADPTRLVVEKEPGVHYTPIANTARLTTATGWQPMFNLEQTVADTWQAASAGSVPTHPSDPRCRG